MIQDLENAKQMMLLILRRPHSLHIELVRVLLQVLDLPALLELLLRLKVLDLTLALCDLTLMRGGKCGGGKEIQGR